MAIFLFYSYFQESIKGDFKFVLKSFLYSVLFFAISYNELMINYLNLSLSNLIIDFFVLVLVCKIFRFNVSFWQIVYLQLFEICAMGMSFALTENTFIFMLIKSVSLVVILMFILDSFKATNIIKLITCYYIIFFSISGFMQFLCKLTKVSVCEIFDIKIANKFDFVVILCLFLYVFAIFRLVSYLSQRKILKERLVHLSFLLFGKHIEFVGFIDSGNSLYDSLTKKPVIVASKKSLEKFFNPSDLENILKVSGRTLECETISDSKFKLQVFNIKNLIVSDGKSTREKSCVLGVVDKVFENTKYDCLLHRDFM